MKLKRRGFESLSKPKKEDEILYFKLYFKHKKFISKLIKYSKIKQRFSIHYLGKSIFTYYTIKSYFSVECYLEATDTAKPLYAKHGFEEITELRFDPSQYGVKGLGIERQTVMVRGAVGSDGERLAVQPWDVAVAHAKADLLQ